MKKTYIMKATALIAMLFTYVALNAQDVISINDALRLYMTHSKTAIGNELKAMGYNYQLSHREDAFNAIHSWYKNCVLNRKGAISKFQTGTTSICEYIVYNNKKAEMYITVFNKKAKDIIFQQVRNAGYSFGEEIPASIYGEVQWNCTKSGMPEIMLSVPMNEQTGRAEDSKGCTVLISQP